MHRNSQKRKLEEYSSYFVTIVTDKRYQYFKNEILCKLFIKELRLSKKFKKLMLFGFCIMPDHVHLLIQSDVGSNLMKDMHFLKRHFSRNANILLGHTEGAVGQPRLREEFTEIDLFIEEKRNVVKLIPKFKWQKSYHDHYIRNQKDFERHLNYINTNHLKHNLPENWSYVGYNFQDLLDL